jgi:acyl-CoA reductase-like NAD-dependent aldehyde dehydrogenase
MPRLPGRQAASPEFDLFIKEVGKEMTLKCGQRCTGARRIMVPEKLVEDVQIALGKRLGGTVIGDPRAEGAMPDGRQVRITMGASPDRRNAKKCATISPN